MSVLKNGLACAIGAVCLASAAHAQDYPSQQITMIVPFGAGGGSDRVARTIDEHWSKAGGQGFKFEYAPGAGGAVGASKIANAPADGYTIGIVNLPDLALQSASDAGTFELDDFAYIGQVNADPLVIMVPENSPYETFDEFASAAKESPGRLTFAVSGTLGAGQIVAQQLNEKADIDLTLVPTQGGANTAARVAGGHVTAGSIGLGLFSSQETGQALAVTSAEPAVLAPDIPTISDSGIDVDVELTRVVVAPAGIPEEALSYLREHLQEVVESDGFQEASKEVGLGPVWKNGSEIEAQLPEMAETYGKVVDQ